MTRQPKPKRLVLAGGGHAHVFVLEALARRPVPGVEITLVTKEPKAPYSGMLPGFVAGHYELDECLIDLERMCAASGARLILDAACGIDRSDRKLLLSRGTSLPYDVLSLNVGITPDVSAIAGAEAHALLVKPVSAFAPKWQALVERAAHADGPRRIIAVGGGAAGVELILAAHHRLTDRQSWEDRRRDPFTYALIAAAGVLPSHPPRAGRLAMQVLKQNAIEVIEGDPAIEIGPRHLRLRSGRTLDCDAALVSTAARAPAWFAQTGLARDSEGYLALWPTLQTLTDEDIFAAGDCATIVTDPRPKAGVFAVRQGPVLARQLQRHLQDQILDPYHAQEQFLTLVSLGEKSAIASRNGLSVAGHWAWLWKDFIDRRFMTRFNRA